MDIEKGLVKLLYVPVRNVYELVCKYNDIFLQGRNQQQDGDDEGEYQQQVEVFYLVELMGQGICKGKKQKEGAAKRNCGVDKGADIGKGSRLRIDEEGGTGKAPETHD